jgi:hypothetical protein
MTTTNKDKQMMTALSADLAFYALGGVPPEAELAMKPKIENWQVVVAKVGNVNALAVKGKIFRSKAVPEDGRRFLSRPVIWFDRRHRFIRCAESLYELGRQVGQAERGQEIPNDGVDQ